MIKIDKNHDAYSKVADIIAAVFGFGASLLTSSFCNSIISTKDCGPAKKGVLKLGAFGLETITMYTVSSTMRNEIDEYVDKYNELSDFVDVYKENKESEKAETHYTYKELNQ